MAKPDGGRVLLVEDEDAVRRLVRRLLERGGFEVVEAATGPNGLALARAEGAKFDALILDVVLPGGCSGPEIAADIQRLHQDMGCVLISGWSVDDLRRHGATAANCLFLPKPFSNQDLLDAVSFAVEWRRAAPK